ncbi:unnamed protein product [Owenia fusiformis]|uniref:Uncharacterized protein n=1 Tax=Owenia fusiformis TaxID=6347 RepID=A0A8J1U9M3_OWEFU|nr:unnamed protein product [Owenia fusiformis]
MAVRGYDYRGPSSAPKSGKLYSDDRAALEVNVSNIKEHLRLTEQVQLYKDKLLQCCQPNQQVHNMSATKHLQIDAWRKEVKFKDEDMNKRSQQAKIAYEEEPTSIRWTSSKSIPRKKSNIFSKQDKREKPLSVFQNSDDPYTLDTVAKNVAGITNHYNNERDSIASDTSPRSVTTTNTHINSSGSAIHRDKLQNNLNSRNNSHETDVNTNPEASDSNSSREDIPVFLNKDSVVKIEVPNLLSYSGDTNPSHQKAIQSHETFVRPYSTPFTHYNSSPTLSSGCLSGYNKAVERGFDTLLNNSNGVTYNRAKSGLFDKSAKKRIRVREGEKFRARNEILRDIMHSSMQERMSPRPKSGLSNTPKSSRSQKSATVTRRPMTVPAVIRDPPTKRMPDSFLKMLVHKLESESISEKSSQKKVEQYKRPTEQIVEAHEKVDSPPPSIITTDHSDESNNAKPNVKTIDIVEQMSELLGSIAEVDAACDVNFELGASKNLFI